jgi:hypothetical protein
MMGSFMFKFIKPEYDCQVRLKHPAHNLCLFGVLCCKQITLPASLKYVVDDPPFFPKYVFLVQNLIHVAIQIHQINEVQGPMGFCIAIKQKGTHVGAT